MAQKVFAGRADDPQLTADLVQVKIDQVVLSRNAGRVMAEALQLGLKKTAVEVAIAYDSLCVTDHTLATSTASRLSREALQLGVLMARPGIGFAPAVHLERFGSPARLVLTDEPRMAAIGGAGMLPLVASPAQLAEALVTGSVMLRPPRSIQVLLSGKLRPFVCARDVALELVRRGLGDAVQRVDEQHAAPVVIEFAGPSARLLSVPERAVMCNLAPQLGAAAALFLSDEKTEVYLRDQRRSKAHRGLVADPGAPTEEVMTVDLSAIDPLLMDADGTVRQVRELSGKPVSQAVLGGDSGISLRDLLAAAALLKSKRVPAKLDLLVAPPSRQALEVLAQSGALADLIATGARVLEPDARLITGELYPPEPNGVSLRTFDSEPGTPGDGSFTIASAETVAYSVASASIGDPRLFKRPVRVTVPRVLPTDDVLILRKPKGKPKAEVEYKALTSQAVPAPRAWQAAEVLRICSANAIPEDPAALVVHSLKEVRWAQREADQLSHCVRAILAPRVPAAAFAVFAGLGMLVLVGSSEDLEKLARRDKLRVPASEEWNSETSVPVTSGDQAFDLAWPMVAEERGWMFAGTANPTAPAQKK